MIYSLYEYDVMEGFEGYIYKIKYYDDYHHCYDYINSDEWYDSEVEADKAAKAHIDRLENGEL